MRMFPVLPLLTALVLASCSDPVIVNTSGLRVLENEYWEWKLREFPEQATWLGENRYNDRLTDLSPEAIEQRKADIRAMNNRAQGMSFAGLNPQDSISLSLLQYELQLAVDGQQFPTEYLVLDQLDGPQLSFAQLASVTPFRDAADYTVYIARLDAYGKYLQQVTSLLGRGIEAGWVQPNGPLRGVPAQIEGQFADARRTNYYDPFEKMPDSIPASQRENLRASAITTINNVVTPSLRKLRDFVRDTYLPAGKRELGASTLPNGKAFYEYQIRVNTTLRLSADSVHKVGLSEVARIHAIMDSVMRASGFKGSFKDFLAFLRTDKQFYYTRAEDLLKGYEEISRRADAQMPKLFAELPKNPYGVKGFPDYEAPSQTTARYYPGAEDGSRQGYFMVNLYKLDMRPKYEMEALTLHEAVPGHHMQITRAQELDNLPAFRRNAGYTAYVEGWGLYAESLGLEMGFYADSYSRFGQLTYEMWRACRLVVDTGIHHLGWTRQHAIDFMTENTAKTEQDIAVEVDRYIVWPGQALAYKIGELKIKELRARAEQELGAKFDLRRFHNALLDNGALPLAILETQIDRWITSQK